jgi:hypothetical protein
MIKKQINYKKPTHENLNNITVDSRPMWTQDLLRMNDTRIRKLACEQILYGRKKNRATKEITQHP